MFPFLEGGRTASEAQQEGLLDLGKRGERAEAEAETEDLCSTLSVEDWVRRYGRIRASVQGSAETLDKVSESSYASSAPASERDTGNDGVEMMLI